MNRKFKPNRQGITLLFVISMIVLFLLMGTAFVIVANDFNRVSVNRILSNVPEGQGSVQGNQLLEEAILQIIRGTNLREVDSPLRTNDLLADQYGYGIRAYVSPSTVPTGNPGSNATVAPAFIGNSAGNDDGFFIQLALDSDPNPDPSDPPDNMCFDLRTLDLAPRPLTDINNNNLGNLSGTFGGRVLSFVSGPAKGFSTRIVADAFTTNGTLQFRIPATSISGDTIDFDPASLAGSEVIINGRDFSGSGANVLADANGDPIGVGLDALAPNRVGRSHTANLLSYLNRSDSVNEPWDAADISNPFLSGFSQNGTLIPSFAPTAFRAFDEGNDGLPDVDTDGDGVPDSYWMDLGMSIITNSQGQRFRPLFAIHIRDLDGLLNLNAHGNLTHLTGGIDVDDMHAWAGGTPPGGARGMGFGTPEINLIGGLSDNQAILTRIMNARYGADQVPGDDATPSRFSRAKLFGHPTTGTVGGLYGTTMDIDGRFLIGTPITTTDPNFINSLPQIDRPLTLNVDEFLGNPYEFSLSGSPVGDDAPFTITELERILRPNDIDSRMLPSRLSNILDDDASINPRLFTTDGYDVPMLFRSFPEVMIRQLRVRGVANDELVGRTNLLNGQLAFAPEFFAGLKMDINRPFDDGTDNNSNNVVGDPNETMAVNSDAENILGTDAAQMDLAYANIRNSAADSNPRVIFARNLYMLAMLLLDPVDLDQNGTVEPPEELAFARAMAQWAVNVVDFRDPDSIHTRFVYDPNPFDAQGWNPTTDDADNDLPADAISFVWGCERPELLITETLAGHNRNTEDLPNGGGTVAGAGGGAQDADFDQRLRPEAFAYFELYNPWVQNDLNQTFDGGLYDNNQGVQITRVNDSGAPVWRFEIERNEGADQDPKPLRYVYMTDPTGAPITYNDSDQNQVPGDIEVFYPATPSNVNIEPGDHAVIGTRGFSDGGNEFRTFLGRRRDAGDGVELDETTHLSLNAAARTLTRYNAISDSSETRNTGIVFVDQAAQLNGNGEITPADERQFSLSDPYDGYDDVGLTPIMNGDGFTYDTIKPQPLDLAGQEDGNRNDADLLKILISNGVSKDFRTIRLQRLANPLIEWDPVLNPYLTIDSMDTDLISYNGAHNPDTDMEPGLMDATDGGAVSHERGFGTPVERQLWTARRSATPAGGAPGDMTHNFDQDLVESLGKTNDADLIGATTFPWLTWNNRPFASHMEIMNVPYLAPDQLTYAPENSTATTFSVDDGTIMNPYTDMRPGSEAEVLAGRYGHLLNFFGTDLDPATNNFADAYRLLDYLEVPSRFVGTESYYLTNDSSGVIQNVPLHPFNTISRYRVPGKININTIPPNEPNLMNFGVPESSASDSSFVWDALADGYVSELDWRTFKDTLYGSVPNGPVTNPFRPADAANLVPGLGPIPGVSCTLLRPRTPTPSENPPFDYDSANLSDDADRSAAFRNGFRTRLGNMVTTKSSVFAGWITVGYFQVDPDDDLTMSGGAGVEIGEDRGEQVRNRAFFVFDRSIPVAYEPGKNHNVDKAIRVKTIID